LLTLKLKAMKSNNIWKIVIGAVSAALGYILNAVPMLDWNLTGQAPQLTVTAITDFPQPAFDQLGMQAVPALNHQNKVNLRMMREQNFS
jgi:hypothetical protein